MRESKKNLSAFSLRLKEARKNRKYTQKKLEEVSGVYLKTIQRYENVKEGEPINPIALNLLNLAQALDLTPEYLLLGEDNMNIYMAQIKAELLSLSITDIHYYNKQNLTDKVLSHLKLTDEFINEIRIEWNKKYHAKKPGAKGFYSNYVQDTIIRYCHHRPLSDESLVH